MFTATIAEIAEETKGCSLTGFFSQRALRSLK